MAVWVLRDNPGCTMDRVLVAMNGETTQQVDLAYPILVLIVYGAAIVPEDELVYFYDDIYNPDAALEQLKFCGLP